MNFDCSKIQNVFVKLDYPQQPLWFDAPSLDELKADGYISNLVKLLNESDFVETIRETTDTGEEYFTDIYKTTFPLPNNNGEPEDVHLLVRFCAIGCDFNISVGYDMNRYKAKNPKGVIKIKLTPEPAEALRPLRSEAEEHVDNTEETDPTETLRFRVFDVANNNYISDDTECFLSFPDNKLELPDGRIMEKGDFLLQNCSGYRDMDGTLIFAGDYLQTDEGNWKAYVVSPDFCLVDNRGGFSAMPYWKGCKIIGRDKDLSRLKENSDNFKIRIKLLKQGNEYEIKNRWKLSSKGDKICIDDTVHATKEAKIELYTGYQSASNEPIMEGDELIDKEDVCYTVKREKGNFYIENQAGEYDSFPDWGNFEIL